MQRAIGDGEREWERCKPWIEAALEYAHGTHLIEDVWDLVLRGEAHFWPGRRAAIVTEFSDFPRLKALHFWLCGGDMHELLDEMRPAVEAWGCLNNCTRFTTCGRPGWARVLKGAGYAPEWHVCRKDVI